MTVQGIAREAITLGLIMTDPKSNGMAPKEAFKHFMKMKERLTDAGAGGRALALAESESDNGGESMADEKNEVIEELEPEAEELETVTLSEQEEPEPEAPPETLDGEKVRELVEATNLPDAAKARLSEAEYADEETAGAAIAAEVAYIKEVTGSGKPFAQGASSAPEQQSLSEEKKTERFNRHMREIGAREVA